jgi:hypothetical protein
MAERVASIALLKNSMGIITAHPEFVSSGIYGQAVKALPFPTVGTTSISHCINGAVDSYMLSVLVLTSDDCSFSCGVSGPVPKSGDVAELTRECYGKLRGNLPEEPKLALFYAPFFNNDPCCQSRYISAISEMNERLPVFGTIANDDHVGTLALSNAQVLCGGEAYKDRFALALISGNISPKFYIDSVTEDAVIMPNIGIITATDGNKLLEINNVKAADFLKDAGFLSGVLDSSNKGLLSSVIILRLNNGASISRIPTHVEEDSLFCGGQLVNGAALSVAFNTKESVIETAKRTMSAIKKERGGGTALIHTCLGRRYGLLNEPMRELELISEILDGGFSYMAAYSSGEFCPVGGENLSNQEHNQTLIVCVF